MYFATEVAVFALIVLVPSLIGLRDRSNANWHNNN
ncbi:hypothetical protein HDF15_003125 [Granulicella mallensis]|jgi:hypothetical protein|uniref:Uncharacterized protein n=1 Tax=Granulicella mallensis TaxID=940614 RepID=A0A7W7ZRE2_9BACT|nr:hypothetical protein [Granulicella mallensis]